MVSERQIQEAGAILRGGGLVAFPTETVYGLGANALEAAAVAKVFAAKARPSFDPLIVHVAEAEAAWDLAEAVPDAARRLAARFWPGPLTLVLPKVGRVPGLVTAGLDSVGLRVPDHDVARRLIRAAGVPVAAPSANPFGGISPTRAERVTVDCDLVLDGGPCRTGVESTVVDCRTEDVTVLRLGGTPAEAIEAALGRAVTLQAGRSDPGRSKPGPDDEEHAAVSPGQTDRHYAPRTPLRLLKQLSDLSPTEVGGRRVGLLNLEGDVGRGMGFVEVAALSRMGDLTEAAAGLFEAMHRLDAAGLDLIVAVEVPDRGLGRAINDRLLRASAQ